MPTLKRQETNYSVYHSDQRFFSYDYDANVLLSTIILQLVNMSKSHNNVHLITIIWSWKNTKLGRYVPPGVTDGWLMKLTLVSELRSC